MSGTVERFGYRVDLEEELGRGGFGTVYKGVGQRGDVVAMKKISKMHKRWASMEAVRHQYLKHNVDHDNIVQVFDVRTWKDSMWIVMDFCDKGDLNDFFIKEKDLVRNDFLKHQMVFDVMLDIAKGLDFLHTKDIVHRDIKPANILMKTNTTAGQSFTAKLGDFGLSKILDPEDMTSAMSTDVGTTAFKAPEFWDREPGEKARYHRNVDVFSTGLTFAAMLQAKPGQNLVPRAQGGLNSWETNMAIGLMAFTRKTDVDLFPTRSLDKVPHLHITIQGMTQTSPENRISSRTALANIETLERYGLRPMASEDEVVEAMRLDMEGAIQESHRVLVTARASGRNGATAEVSITPQGVYARARDS